MSSDLDAILRQVAAGELTPEEALPLIDAAQAASAPPADRAAPEWGTPTAGPGSPGGPETESTAAGREGPARDVRISVSYRSLDIVGDPTVDQIAVTGGHTVRREGDSLVVECTQFQGFTEFESGRFEAAPGAWSFLPRSAAWARGMKGEHVTIRVNRSLPITLDTAGAAVRISGCEGGARIRAVAASLKLDRLRGPLQLDALTSSVKGSVSVTGDCRISAESASVKLTLLPGSDVRVSSSANRLGKIVLPGSPQHGPVSESVLGNGSGRLVVDGVMSSVVLSADQDAMRVSA
ncbi:MAG TPA: hypothetical protein VI248_23935 [Kineosporiaceae bacterium]